jgi:hypothetical protein
MNDLENKYKMIESRVNQVDREVYELIDFILPYCMEEMDFEMAEKLCRLYINSAMPNLVYIGVQCAGHIARVYKKIVDIKIIQNIIHIANDHRPVYYPSKDQAVDVLYEIQELAEDDIYSKYSVNNNYTNKIEFQKKQRYEKGKSVNPQSLFHLRVRVLPDRPRQYAAEGENFRAVVIDEYLPGKYCYHFRKYSELSYNLEFNDQLIRDQLPDEEEE